MHLLVDTRTELPRARNEPEKPNSTKSATSKLGMVDPSTSTTSTNGNSDEDADCWIRLIPEDDELDSPVSEKVARPLEFPTPLVWKGELCELNCLDPTTGKEYALKNVLMRVGQKEDETDDSPCPAAKHAYLISKKLSKSTHGTVRLGVVLQRRTLDYDKTSNDYDESLFGPLWESTNEMVSIKVSSWERINSLRGRHLVDPIKEIAALQHVGNNHQHVAGCIEVLQDDKNLYTVSRYCPNGDLYGAIDPPELSLKTNVDETEPRKWFRQLLLGLVHLQQKGVCHKNINFENLMIDQFNQLVITDFALSLRVPYSDARNAGQVTDVSEGSDRLNMTAQGQSGKLMFLPPEILEDKPFDGFAADLWSAGVVLFVLLVGVAPFQMAQMCDKRYETIARGGLKGLLESFDISLSPEALDLLQCMFQEDPRDRLSLSAVLHHPWVMDRRFPSPPEEEAVTPKMRTKKSYLRKSAPANIPPSIPELEIRGPDDFSREWQGNNIDPQSYHFETRSTCTDGIAESCKAARYENFDTRSLDGRHDSQTDGCVKGDGVAKWGKWRKSDYFIDKLRFALKKKHYGTI